MLIMMISPSTSAVRIDGLRETIAASAIAPAGCELLLSDIGRYHELDQATLFSGGTGVEPVEI